MDSITRVSNLPPHFWAAENLTVYKDSLFQIFFNLSPFGQSSVFQLSRNINLFFSQINANQIEKIYNVIDQILPFFNGDLYANQKLHLQSMRKEFEIKKSLPDRLHSCSIFAQDLCTYIKSLSIADGYRIKHLLTRMKDEFSPFILNHLIDCEFDDSSLRRLNALDSRALLEEFLQETCQFLTSNDLSDYKLIETNKKILEATAENQERKGIPVEYYVIIDAFIASAAEKFNDDFEKKHKAFATNHYRNSLITHSYIRLTRVRNNPSCLCSFITLRPEQKVKTFSCKKVERAFIETLRRIKQSFAAIQICLSFEGKQLNLANSFWVVNSDYNGVRSLSLKVSMKKAPPNNPLEVSIKLPSELTPEERLFDLFTITLNRSLAPFFKALALQGENLEALKLDAKIINLVESYFNLYFPHLAKKAYVQGCLKDLHENFIYIINNPACSLTTEGEAKIEGRPSKRKLPFL